MSSGSICPAPRLAWRSAPVPGRVARVVGVDEVDAAGDRAHPLDDVREVLAGGVCVAGVEAEADLDVSVGGLDLLPQLCQRVSAPGDRVVAAGRVLEVDRDLALQHLERAAPALDALVDAVLGMARVDDQRGRAQRRGGLALLAQDLARAVADVRLGRADVDQVGRVDVEVDGRVAELGGVVAGRRLLPALRLAVEDLDDLDIQLGGCGERRSVVDVGADLGELGHAPSIGAGHAAHA